MNLSLLDPFALVQEYPNNLSQTLKWGRSCCTRFNRKGDYLASGLVDGTIVIFDYDTYGVSIVLRGHTRAIQSLCWSRNGRYLLSASQDWKCILWDLLTGKPDRVITFQSPVWGAALHPEYDHIFVASFYEDSAKYVDVTDKKEKIIILPSFQQRKADKEADDATEPATITTPSSKRQDKQLTLATIFNKRGDHIIAGTSKGFINIFKTGESEILYSTRIANCYIKSLQLSTSGRTMVASCSDRIIRLLTVPNLSRTPVDEWELDTEHKFQDVVNRVEWNGVTLSTTGEYVLATSHQSGHDIYMWETSMGSLVKIYEGPKEDLGNVQWHPSLPIMSTTGVDSGRIYIWSSPTPQRWSALAPDFVEVEENVEYEEKEDEFDLVDEELQNKRQLDVEDEEVVDVVTIERNRGEYGEHSFVIPLDLETQEVPPGSDDDD